MIKPLLYMLGLASLLSFSALVLADDEPSFTSYDSIVNQLRASAADEKPVIPPNDDFNWEEVAIHGGIGLATTWESVSTPNGASGAGMMKGVTANFGMNLFTRRLRAEGAFSSYAQEDFNQSLKASLKEFELRLVYLTNVDRKTALRFGLGLAARYLTLDAVSGTRWADFQSTTPSSVIMLGFERKITSTIALGPDISYRSALISDTFDKSAWNASFRLNATF